jgi:dipeptidyl aminopeptidase/acylaminoacyl peptidase
MILTLVQHARAEETPDVLRAMPIVPAGAKRLIALDDLLRLRDIDSLSLSADGSHFAILVRQAVPERNRYRTGWFVGSTAGGDLTFVGDGGDARLLTFPDGTTLGDISGGPGRWSPDGTWVAYLVKRNDEVQLWRSRRDGRVEEQLTHNAADVRDFAWSKDGRAVYFTAGTHRAQLQARYRAEAWRGYRFDDFLRFAEIINPGHPPRALEENPQVWIADLEPRTERTANADEARDFERLRSVGYIAGESGAELPKVLNGAGARPAVSSKGTLAWLARTGGHFDSFPQLRVTASNAPDGSNPISCQAPECSGTYIETVWWSADASRVLFWNLDERTGLQQALYAWSPSTGKVSVLVHPSGDGFTGCAMAAARLICLRETAVEPAHVAAIDTQSGAITVIADVNPELKNIRFGKVERIEWEVPSTVPKLFPPRTFGYILYPPDFDPSRQYPVFIAPYYAGGFQRGDVGNEHPLYVYAANGILVLHTSFPFENSMNMTSADLGKLLFSSEQGFPYHTTMLKSTLRALDLVAARGFIDEKRVGIGGLSQGSDNPLYMLTKVDRIAAVSVAGGYKGPWMYYATTPRGGPRSEEYYPAPIGEGLKWWDPIDVAQHVDKIKAPILFNIPDQEIEANTTLFRHLEDAHKPFDAYVFPGEYHEKWQSAHRQAVYQRNLDWFRFWLQDYEDPDPCKAEQYERWRELRALQRSQNSNAKNPIADSPIPN